MPGREHTSAEQFGEFVGYLTGLQQRGEIEAFDPVFLNAHGGDLNGFFLIRGAGDKLDRVVATDEWMTHMLRAELHLEGAGAVRGHTGDSVAKLMETWTKLIP